MSRTPLRRALGALGDKADRADRLLGRAFARAMGWFCLLVAAGVTALMLAAEDFDWSIHWAPLLFAAVFLGIARLCFGSRATMLEILSEQPPDRPR